MPLRIENLILVVRDRNFDRYRFNCLPAVFISRLLHEGTSVIRITVLIPLVCHCARESAVFGQLPMMTQDAQLQGTKIITSMRKGERP
jgi:hypothetical protein